MIATRWIGLGVAGAALVLCCGCGSSKPVGEVPKLEGGAGANLKPKGMNSGPPTPAAGAAQGQPPAKAGGPVVSEAISTP
jgi:hypothetical protein